jgi:hypothetical protein
MQDKESLWMIEVVLTTPLFCLLAIHSNAYLIPVICILPAYPVMAYSLKHKTRGLSILLMMLWALLLGTSMTALLYWLPEVTQHRILYGERYWKVMIEWVLTGVGRESDPMQFIPVHIIELVVFVMLSLLTGSLLSILMGAVLMNFMAFYVGHLALFGHSPELLVLGWHPWSIVRIASYIIMGVVLSEPMLSKILRYRYHREESRKLLYLALSLWVLDLIIKALLAPTWQKLLKGIVSKYMV